MQAPHVESILEHLARAEQREINPWLRDDLRIAWLTVLYASEGRPQPFVLASYRVLGIHPDKLQAAMNRRRRSLLGRMYEQVVQDLPPKKQSISVSRRELSARSQRRGRRDETPPAALPRRKT